MTKKNFFSYIYTFFFFKNYLYITSVFAQCLTSCGPFVCRVVRLVAEQLSDDWLPGGGSPAECVAKSKNMIT